MQDKVVVTNTQNLFSRIMNSFAGVAIGLLLFLAAFVVLFWNEGREGLLPLARSSSEISSANQDNSNNNKLVSASGKVTISEKTAEEQFLKPLDLVAISRKVEIYAWEEDSDTDTKTNIGGSQETTTTYSYKLSWTSDPEDSSEFKQPQGHQNPVKSIKDEEYRVKELKVGTLVIDPEKLDLPGFEEIELEKEMLLVTDQETDGKYIYVKASGEVDSRKVSTEPKIGDMRISYTALAPGFDATVFGKYQNGKISLYTSDNGQQIFRLFEGDRSAALAAISGEDSFQLWLIRLVGFFMMWIGLSMIASPLTTMMDIIPLLGSLGKSAIGGITFVISLVLTIATVLISIILHNILLLMLCVFLLSAIIAGVAILVKNPDSPLIRRSNQGK